jgi:rhamnose transport system substrate-binding protein
MANSEKDDLSALSSDLLAGRRSRRSFLKLGIAAGFALPTLGAVLAACATGSSAAPSAASSTAPSAASSTAPSAASSTAPSAAKLNIFHVPKFTGFIFFELARKGINEAVKEYGVDPGKSGEGNTYIGADKADTQQQVQVLQNIVPQKPDLLLLAALDVNALGPSLTKMRSNGCKIVTYDSDVSADTRDIFINMMTFPQQGAAILDSALANFADGGKAIWMGVTPTTTNIVAQKSAIDQLIKDQPDKYGKIVFIDTLFMNDDPDTAKRMATDALAAHPDLKYLLSGSSMATPACNQAIIDTGNKGKVFATGFGLPSMMSTYLADGTVKQFALWSPLDLGYLGAQAGVQLCLGTIKAEPGVKFTAGRLGERTLDDQRVAILGAPMFFTKEHPDFT